MGCASRSSNWAISLSSLGQLLLDLLALEGGQAAQLHVQDRLRLDLGELEALHQAGAGGLGVRRVANGVDHLVQVVERNLQALEDVGAGAGLVQLELGAAGEDLVAVVDVVLQQALDVENTRLAVHQRQQVDAEGALHGRELEQVVEHLPGVHIAPQLDDDAHALAVGFVAQVGDAFDTLVAHQVGDPLDQRRLVDLVGQLGDDDGRAVAAAILDEDLGPDDDAAVAGRYRRR